MGAISWVDILAVIVALGFAGIGLWRGFRRAMFVTLAGIVLGVMMGTLWGDAWAPTLATKMSADVDVMQGVIRLGSLLFILLFVGYGSGFFLPSKRPLSVWQRLLGGLVGLCNGLLLEAFSFQYIQRYFFNGQEDSVLQTSPFSSGLLEGLPWVFLGVVLIVSMSVVVIGMIRLARYLGQLTQQPAEVAPVESVPAPVPDMSAPATFLPEPVAVEPVVVEMSPVPEEPSVPCPNCEQPLSFGASYCPHCGKIVA